MDRVIVQLNYNYYLADENISLDELRRNLGLLIPVNRDYVDSKELFSPSGESLDFKIDFCPEENIREATKEEKENAEISTLKWKVEQGEGALEKKEKELEAALCKIKLLEQEQENDA